VPSRDVALAVPSPSHPRALARRARERTDADDEDARRPSPRSRTSVVTERHRNVVARHGFAQKPRARRRPFRALASRESARASRECSSDRARDVHATSRSSIVDEGRRAGRCVSFARRSRRFLIRARIAFDIPTRRASVHARARGREHTRAVASSRRRDAFERSSRAFPID